MVEFEDRTGTKRTFRAVIERLGRDERQRVVPLPVTIAAILFPFLAAWATASERAAGRESSPLARPDRAGGPSAVQALSRTSRAAIDPNGYVDIYGAPEPWESELLERHGYVAPLSVAEYPVHAGRESNDAD